MEGEEGAAVTAKIAIRKVSNKSDEVVLFSLTYICAAQFICMMH